MVTNNNTTPQTPKKKASLSTKLSNFAIGGCSGMLSTCVIQPIDMVKVRIQLKSEALGKGAKVSPFGIIKDMMANGKGFRQFYRGLDSALMRQITYTTTRLGIYNGLLGAYEEKHHKPAGFLTKSLYGMSAGFLGSLVGCPSDLILVRLQADQTLPESKRRNYKNFGDALRRIIKEEGAITLWRGAGPTVVRAVSLNLGMLGPFTEVKQRLNTYYGTKDTLQTRIMAASVSGFFASFFSLPFDNAKIKMQKMVKGPDGQFPYKNIFHTVLKSQQQEGFLKLWVGFPTFYFRIAPHCMLTWIFIEYSSDFIHSFTQK